MDSRIADLEIEPVHGSVLCRSRRKVIGRVYPATAEQVAEVVLRASERGWPIHPVSGGMNWGMGSYLPPIDNRLIVDLSRLNQIGPLDAMAGTIKIEAGVSQQQLFDWLKTNAPEFAFNVTGAAKRTSIMGNAMQRGIGYDGSRADEIFGYEVVLRDGSVHGPDAGWFSTTGGIPVGPRFDALWSQSDFGIVTAGWLRLRRKQQRELAVVFSGEMASVFATLQHGYRRNLLHLPVHLAGKGRAQVVSKGLLWRHWGREPSPAEIAKIFPPTAGVTAIAGIRGETAMVATQLKALRRHRRRGVKVRALGARDIDRVITWAHRLGFRRKRDFFACIRPLLALAWGEPSDAGMAAMDTDPQTDADLAQKGMVYFNAISAFDLQQSEEVEAVVEAVFPGVALTRIIQDATQIVHVFSVEFADEHTATTHEKILSVGAELRQRGYPPYRLGSVRPDHIDAHFRARMKKLLETVVVDASESREAR